MQRKTLRRKPSVETCIFMMIRLLMMIPSVASHKSDGFVMFEPAELKQVLEGTNHMVSWYSNLSSITRVTANVRDEMVAEIASIGSVMNGRGSDNASFYGRLNISALLIGYTEVYLEFYDDRDVIVGEESLSMSVLLSYQKINDIFTLALGIIVAVAYVNMGATMDLTVVKKVIKKPIGPLLGIICQYLFMPMIAFGLGKVAFPGNRMAQLGMFLSGSSPGGGLSNMWTYLLGGSLDLSIMMTFASNLVAFGSVPMWVFLMGPVIMGDTDFVIPYKDIAILVATLSVPCSIGIIIQKFLPRVAKVLEKLLTPISIFNILFTFTFGIYANIYIFSYFTWKTMLAGLALPCLGYLSGMTLAKLCCQPKKDIIAITIETGVQNNTVAFFILKFTFEKPAGDLTAVFPAAAVIMTPIPLLLAYTAKRIYECRTQSQSQDFTDANTKKYLEKVEVTTKVPRDKGTNQDMISNGNDLHPPQSADGGLDNPAVDLKDESV